MSQVDGTCVEVAGVGVLLRGPSGSGKSDLALRLIDGGGRLIADDRTDLALEDGRLVASAPARIAGRLEVRGVGIAPVPAAAKTVLGLVIDLTKARDVERLPEPDRAEYLGKGLPRLALAPFEASAAAKVRLAARMVGQGIIRVP